MAGAKRTSKSKKASKSKKVSGSKRGTPAKAGAAAALREYRRKRDFRKTSEPGGGSAAPRHDRLRFVIQKHAASRLHYDLRLELHGVMRSWAVPKGPSLDPAVKRLAMQVEDHPIEYNTFEGTIPQGEYGGGTVMLWDRGTYAPDDARPGEAADAAVRRGLSSGKLSFTLRGERLRGSFALVRTDRGPKPKWLLIKHRDDEAAAGLDIAGALLTSVETGRTMDEIAADADRVWHSNRGARRARPAAAPATDGTIAPMQPTPARTLPDGDWTFEPWRGGTRALAWVTPDGARLVGARGDDVTRRHPQIAAALAALARRTGSAFVMDGELAIQNGEPTFFAADLLLRGDQVLLDRPWTERRAALAALLRRRRVPGVEWQETVSRGETMLRRAADAGWPGVLARRADAAYEPGTRAEGFLCIT
ncbi:MAG: DNA polymerase ligase N-terminal domain-containing protein [Gemmatimonadota bacterium]